MRSRVTSLPQRQRSLIGAWCFVDHYGPDDTAATGGMDVPPHPHTGLATVSWLFTGEVEHRDSHGVHAVVRPGELNLMTGGHGIAHSEVSTADTTVLHGVQLWVALPDAHRDAPRAFAHHVPDAVACLASTAQPGGCGECVHIHRASIPAPRAGRGSGHHSVTRCSHPVNPDRERPPRHSSP